jgi:hypothetical protein
MVTMAERLKGVEKDVSWIKKTNIEQNVKIQAVFDKLDNLNTGLHNMATDLPNRFACKDTEHELQKLKNTWYYYAGGFAALVGAITLIVQLL